MLPNPRPTRAPEWLGSSYRSGRSARGWRRPELLNNLAPVPFQNRAAVFQLTAGLDEITVLGGRVVKFFHQGEQRGLLPGEQAWADRAPAAGLPAWLLGYVWHESMKLALDAFQRDQGFRRNDHGDAARLSRLHAG